MANTQTMIAKSLQKENDRLKEDKKALLEAIEFYQKGIGHFYKCINFKSSFLDAEAITFMNEHEIRFKKALQQVSQPF